MSKDRVYLAIGKIAADWGAIDYALDMLVSVAVRRVSPPAEFPRALRRKMRFLRSAFDGVPLLEPFAGEGCNTLARINAIKRDRHKVVHGVVLETAMNDLGYRLVHSEFDGHQRITREHPISLVDLERSAAEIGALMRDLYLLVIRILDAEFRVLAHEQQDR
jgi:hypothetical protein